MILNNQDSARSLQLTRELLTPDEDDCNPTDGRERGNWNNPTSGTHSSDSNRLPGFAGRDYGRMQVVLEPADGSGVKTSEGGWNQPLLSRLGGVGRRLDVKFLKIVDLIV